MHLALLIKCQNTKGTIYNLEAPLKKKKRKKRNIMLVTRGQSGPSRPYLRISCLVFHILQKNNVSIHYLYIGFELEKLSPYIMPSLPSKAILKIIFSKCGSRIKVLSFDMDSHVGTFPFTSVESLGGGLFIPQTN